ncbi:hypothetical protein [Actinomadura hibisca]|uniref:hypothetical protein n=1 Tax=Actinomadura hibisca TaxID=68565 RepID=UPI000B0A46F4|nr:hypothetical protein [Actinomadura hibisca]
MAVPPGPPLGPPPSRQNGHQAALGCSIVGVLALLLLGGCGVVVALGNEGGKPTAKAGKSSSTPTPSTPSPSSTPTPSATTSSATPSSTPQVDGAARKMCTYVAYASAYRTAGIASKATVALTKARTAGAASRLPAARKVAVGGAAQMSTWCTANVPGITPPRVRKPSPRPTPTRTKTRTPKPPAPPEDDNGGRSVRPGAFCSPPGATGTYRGRVYTCKGPGQARWRR